MFVNDQTGVIEMKMDPADPNTLLVATWQRQRDAFDTNSPAIRWESGAGLWKTTDGGKTFHRITKGLPTVKLGRIGLDYWQKNSKVVFMVLESEWTGKAPENSPYMGITGANAEVGAKLTSVTKGGPAEKSGLKINDIVLGIGGKKILSYNEMLKTIRQHVAGETVKVDVVRDRKAVAIDLKLGQRPKGPNGQPGRSPFAAMLNGQRANMQDEQGKDGHQYGGIYRSDDGGESWKRINSCNPRPMYFSELRVDPNDDKLLWVLGIRLWRSKDGGKTLTPDAGRGTHPDHHAMWIDPNDGRRMILGNDGGIYVTYDRGEAWDHLNHVSIGQFYHVGVGPRLNYRVYGGLQDNGSWGGPSRVRNGGGPINTDWDRIGGGDGFLCRVDPNNPDRIYFESQNGNILRRNTATGEYASIRPRVRRARGQRGAVQRYRWNWRTPFQLSSHNTKIYYTAANFVFRSLDRGNGMVKISPDITATERGSATALSESTRNSQVLYVGTDDGAVHRTKDGGHTWTDLRPDPVKPKAKKPDATATKQPRPTAPIGNITAAKKENGNGKPAAAKKKPAPDPMAEQVKRRVQSMLQRFDANGDGAIQADEFPAGAAGMRDRMDTDKNGVITVKELTAAMNERARAQAGRRANRRRAAAPASDGSKPLRHWLPERRWVNHLESSRFVDGRVYLVCDGHRSNDDRPHVYVSENYGDTWRPLHGKLPSHAGTTRVLKEDLVNPNLLYLGTEMGAFVSLDRGETWVSLHTNLPTVAVHGFALHPKVPEIVAATHGRSLWVLDISALRQMTKEVREKDLHLFAPAESIQWRPNLSRGAVRTYRGTNPAAGANLQYWLKSKAQNVTLRVMGPDGKVVRDLEATGEAGWNSVRWNLRANRPAGRRGRFFRGGPLVGPGSYRVELKVGDQVVHQLASVKIDPDNEDEAWIAFLNQEEAMEAERAYNKSVSRYPVVARNLGGLTSNRFMTGRRRWLVCVCLVFACADSEETSPAVPSPPDKSTDDATIPIDAVELGVQAMLRQIVSAQSHLQKAGVADENQNGIGEFGGLAELSGAVGVRDARTLDPAVLPPAFRTIDAGGVTRLGYKIRVALPSKSGWVWERDAGGFAAGAVDAVKAEKRWVAYAWPIDPTKTKGRAFAIDERGKLHARNGDRTVKSAAALDESWLELPGNG